MKIKAAIASYRNERNPRILLIRTAYALCAMALLAIALLVVRRFSCRIEVIQSHKTFRLANFVMRGWDSQIAIHVLDAGYLYLHFGNSYLTAVSQVGPKSNTQRIASLIKTRVAPPK